MKYFLFYFNSMSSPRCPSVDTSYPPPPLFFFFTCRYQGFQSTRVAWSPTLSPAGTRVKMAQVFFESPDLATIAKDALDGFTLKKDWKMTVVHV